MKIFSLSIIGALLLPLAGVAFAQDINPKSFGEAVVQRKGSDGRAGVIFVVTGNDRNIKYKASRADQNDNAASLSDFDCFFKEPAEYREALDLYANRRYADAAKRFKEVQETYKNLKDIPFNYSTMSEFRALESARKMMDISTMAKADTGRLKRLLPMDEVRNQADIYALWALVSKKDWSSLEKDARKMRARDLGRLTREQIVQASYLLGLAYAKQGKKTEALNTLGEAMNVDSTNSIEITKEAILRSMEIYAKDENVVAFLKINTPKSKVQAPKPLQEAAALMNLWKNELFISPEVPKEYQVFLDFYKPLPKKAPVSKAAEKPAAKPAADAKAPAPAKS